MSKISKNRRDALDQFGISTGENINFVVESSLCHGCGACEAVCPTKAISMEYDDKQGILLPAVSEPDCTQCGDCVKVCSGFELDLNDRPCQEDDLKNHDLIGPHKNIYRSYTLDNRRRELSTSGGMATEIVANLLETEMVDAAILVKMNQEEPLRAEGYIAESVDEIEPSHKSKYCPVALNAITRDLIFPKGAECSKKYVFVGLPHHVHGLRLSQELHPELKYKIPFVVSLFTAHTPSQKATEFLLYKKGIPAEDVSSLEYRGGGNPGRMKITKMDGTNVYVPHLDRIYSGHVFPLFFYPIREWLYFDKISEWSDFSCGDNWMGGHKDQLGASTVITRSKKADQVILDMRSKGKIYALEMSTEQLIRDQGLTKKLDVSSRLTVWKMLGRKIPHYTRAFVGKGRADIRTIRFALFVLLTSRKMSFGALDLVITADYYFRALPMRRLRELKGNLKKVLSMLKISKSKKWPQKENKKFILIGGYGHDDIGDEAMPHAVRLNLRDRFGETTEINMFSVDPFSTESRHNEKSQQDFNFISCGRSASWKVRAGTKAFLIFLLLGAALERFGLRLALWPTARAAIDEIISADAIINVGGGNLNSIMPEELYKKCTTYLVAYILRRPVFLTGQTIGPFNGLADRVYARLCLNTVDVITLRDMDTSQTRLRKLGVTKKPIIFDSADDAITLSGNSDNRALEILEQETSLSAVELEAKPLVILNMKASLRQFKGYKRDGSLENEISLMSVLADRLVSSFDINIVFVGTDFSHNADDREIHERVINCMRRKDRVFSVDGLYEDQDLIALVRQAALVIGGRYHFNVFAASQNTPFIGFASGLYQMTKLQGLASLVGIKDTFMPYDMESAVIDDVWPQIERVYKNRIEIKEEMRASVVEMKRRSRKIYDYISDTVERGRRSDIRHYTD